MPKGVEHFTTTRSSGGKGGVRKSVMPKGVEHLLAKKRAGVEPGCGSQEGGKALRTAGTTCRSAASSVRKSVMPKGVEHVLSAVLICRLPSSAEVSDAERR